MTPPRPRAALAAGVVALLLGAGTTAVLTLDGDETPPGGATAATTGSSGTTAAPDRGSPDPTPTGVPTETPAPSADPTGPVVVAPAIAPGPDTVPADLPLTEGLPETTPDGDPVVVLDSPAFRGLRVCGRAAWQPGRPVGAAGVRYDDEDGERTRTLVVLRDAATARTTLTRLHDALARCSAGPGAWQLITTPSPDPAQELVVATHLTTEDDLQVLRVARMGRAVLVVTDRSTPRPLPVGAPSAPTSPTPPSPSASPPPPPDPAIIAAALERSAAQSAAIIVAMAATWPPG